MPFIILLLLLMIWLAWPRKSRTTYGPPPEIDFDDLTPLEQNIVLKYTRRTGRSLDGRPLSVPHLMRMIEAETALQQRIAALLRTARTTEEAIQTALKHHEAANYTSRRPL